MNTDRPQQDAATDLLAIGQLAAQLRVPVREIEAAMLELRMRAAMRLNYVLYLDGAQVQQLTEQFASTAARRHFPKSFHPAASMPELPIR